MKQALALSGETPARDILADFPAGVGLVRGEYLLRAAGVYVSVPGMRDRIRNYLVDIADRTSANVWYRTSDLEAGEASVLRGVEEVLFEPIPQLGLRGVRRGLRHRAAFVAELSTFAAAQRARHNLRLLFPFVSSLNEAAACVRIARECGVTGPLGLMAETPSAVLVLPELLECGFEHVVVGCNDLWSLTMARANLPGVYPTATTALRRQLAMVRDATCAAGASAFLAGYLEPSLVQAGRDAGFDAAVYHYAQLPALLGDRYQGLAELDHLGDVKKRSRQAVAEARDAALSGAL